MWLQFSDEITLYNLTGKHIEVVGSTIHISDGNGRKEIPFENESTAIFFLSELSKKLKERSLIIEM